ncbi:RNA pseudouridylate synthase [Theileria orientalis]|uniref:RNA pseudouridylate synthase n=1 Tax=Theileria orientalis TaxID=68886 RepID=A0A976XJX3_THEOR|nr:RNA pseudouridylate synthase [Theileria orientalis]
MKRKLNEIQEDDSSQDLIEENPYRIVNGYRLVVPYLNVYKTYVKQRWMGKQLYNVLTDEFAAFNDEYIRYASSRNKIKVFDKDDRDIYPNSPSKVLVHKLKPNEKIVHYASVHEPISLHTHIRVLHEDDDYIVVSKPTSLPVYRTGTYKYNTLIEVLKYEVDCCKNLSLYPVHRIDKLVSGIVAFAKSSKAATVLSQSLRDKSVRKVYIARVCGNFSDFVRKCEECDVDETINDEILNKIVTHHGYMHPISIKLSKHEFTDKCLNNKYKPATTRFRFIAYNKDLDESLILVSPITGRTHQIRAHLKFLGHSISNDPSYNNGGFTDSSEYFREIPIVNWQIDDEGNWCIPEIGFYDKSENKPTKEDIRYHIGLNNKSDGTLTKTGIFLHSLRYIWDKHFDVSDSLPKWIDKFDIDGKLEVTKLNLW